MQVLVNEDTRTQFSTNAGRKKGCGASPSNLQVSAEDEWCSPTTGYEGATWDVSNVRPCPLAAELAGVKLKISAGCLPVQIKRGKSFTITIMKAITPDSTDEWGLEHICDQNAIPQQNVRRSATSAT